MPYQRGDSLKKLRRKDGEILGPALPDHESRTAERVENTLPIGLRSGLSEGEGCVARSGPGCDLHTRIRRREIAYVEDLPASKRLSEQYLKNGFGADAVRFPKPERTVLNTGHIVRAHPSPAGEVESRTGTAKPLEIQRWLQSLHSDQGLAWTTISKMRGTMLRVYKVGILHELVKRNPVVPVETRAVTSYKAILVTPQQTLAILQNLQNPLHRILVLTCAATALRSSELLTFRMGGYLLGAVQDCHQQALVSRQGWADQEPEVRRPRSASSGLGLSPE